MQSNQPPITAAQIVAVLVALIAPTASLLAAFGVYTLTASQQGAINDMIVALAGLGAVIAAADAHLRAARNKAHAQIESAPKPIVIPPPPAPAKPARSHAAKKG